MAKTPELKKKEATAALTQATDMVSYQVAGVPMILTKRHVLDYLVSGHSEYVTDAEVVMFLKICSYRGLNPWLREVYLIKYSQRGNAAIVVGKDALLKRAAANPKYRGHKAWAIEDDAGKPSTGIAEVYVKDYDVPIEASIAYDEYVQMTRDKKTGKTRPNKMWSEKPRTMLRKVALCQALREAFPEDLGGLYSQEEIDVGELDTEPVKQPKDVTPEVEEPKGEGKDKKKEKVEPVEEQKEAEEEGEPDHPPTRKEVEKELNEAGKDFDAKEEERKNGAPTSGPRSELIIQDEVEEQEESKEQTEKLFEEEGEKAEEEKQTYLSTQGAGTDKAEEVEEPESTAPSGTKLLSQKLGSITKLQKGGLDTYKKILYDGEWDAFLYQYRVEKVEELSEAQAAALSQAIGKKLKKEREQDKGEEE